MSEHRSQYWRSLEQLADTDEFREFLHREFPVAASELPEEDGPDGFSRRRWMQLMGASLALGGAVGCRWPEDKIVPFVDRPENRIPGKPQVFATAWQIDGVARALTVRSFDGRPTKTAGNKQYAYSWGGTDVLDQALPLGLYDPDRAAEPTENGQLRTWGEANQLLRSAGQAAESNGGEGLAVLSEPSSSLVLADLRGKFTARFPKAQWVDFAPVVSSSQRVGLATSDEASLKPVYRLENADIVVSIDADPLGGDSGSTGLIGAWASRRAPEAGDMNRTYVIESQFSGTGTAGDHRLGVKSSEIPGVVAKIVDGVKSGSAGEAPAVTADYADRIVHAIVSDLLTHKGASALIVGGGQSPDVHKAVAALNELLGNVGKTVDYIEVANRPDDFEGIAGLIESMRAGRIETLLVLGGNPAYTCPPALGLPAALEAAKTVIRVSPYFDETAASSTWHLNETHPLEQWDVLSGPDGTALSQQPLIDPILEGRSINHVVAQLVGEESDERALHHEAVKAAGADSVEAAVETGVVEGSAPSPVETSFGEPVLEATPAGDSLELVLSPGETTYDGRFANNAWLQETPGRVTKVVWDNVATISPNTANELGVSQGELVTISANGETITAPAFLMPGQARGSIGLSLGYGRASGGRVAAGDPEAVRWTFDQPARPDGPVGVDATSLRTAEQAFIITGVTLTPTGKSYPIATTQDHHAIDETGLAGIEDRVADLVREGTVEEWEKHHDFPKHQTHHPPLKSLWGTDAEAGELNEFDEWDYEGRKWGMTIDLSKCVGCSACVTACTAENNIPVVGKGQVIRGREMHWVRLDRYFAFPEDGVGSGTPNLDNPRVVTQPVACHHCENAPCEQVCPVAATVHSAEGLNDMVYNRCIGTRYCANNCPYKVRRFNFFNYNKAYDYDAAASGADLQALVLNPDVTVRARGVMEKCTYCVQRIKGVTQDARNDRRAIEDGEIQTACQEACPAGAIVFGDLSQDDWSVTQLATSPRAYAMLSELNVKPRTRYLARIRNPHPSLADLEPAAYEANHLDHHGEGGHGDEHHGGEEAHGGKEAHGGESHDHGEHSDKKPEADAEVRLGQPQQPLVQLGSFIKRTMS